MGTKELTAVRNILLPLPGVTERLSHRAPSFYVNKRIALARFHDHHRGDSRISVWCPLPDPTLRSLLKSDRTRFYTPTPSSSGVFLGWVAALVDDDAQPDWENVRSILEIAYRHVAPQKLTRLLDEQREA